MTILFDALLWFATISVGLMAGIYFAFSAFVMKSLDVIEKPSGMLAMQSINRVILKSTFLPIFFASTLASVALIIMAILDNTAAGAQWALVGSALYVAGMFIVTVVGNVPLNNQLEATDAHGADATDMWRRYMEKWTSWNHVRTVACLAALILLILAIAARTA